MAPPPPLAVRSFVLLAAIALLATAVCTKTEKANEPATQTPMTQPADPVPPEPIEQAPAEPADAGTPPPTAIQEITEPSPAPNPPANAADGRKNKNKNKNKNNRSNKKPDKEFFPATKSGGMF